MVLAEKGNNNDSGPRNGRRSRGPSPNGLHHQQADSTSEDDTSVPVDKIRVGRDYQAVCPELQPEVLRKPELIADRALLVWSPTLDIAEVKLEDYIVLAKDKYGYNGEQALGMLFWHKHDLERAVLDLANFTPFPDEWSVEDKVLFEQAFQFHGKSFHRIRQMLPDKSIASLVKYYYGWKKTRSRTSLMDKQARKLQSTSAIAGKSAGGNTGNDDATVPQSGAASGCGAGEHNASDPNSGNDDSDREESNKNTSYGGKVPIQPRQTLTLKRKHSEAIDDLRMPNDRTACRWTHDELTSAVEGVRKYGKDFKAISEALGGNKSEQHVRAFYINYRKKYGLDTVFREWEKEHSSNNAAPNIVAIAIATTTNNTGKTKSNSRPIMARDNNNTGLLLSEQNKQQLVTPTVIDIDDDDDDDDNNSDNASDVICISPSPPPSQPLSAPPTNNLSITATQQQQQSHSNGKVLELATSAAHVVSAQNNATLVVGAQILK